MDIKRSVAEIHSFSWKGISRKGLRVSGELQAISVTEVKAELRKQSINVIRIRKKAKPLFSFGNRITAMDIAIFSRQI